MQSVLSVNIIMLLSLGVLAIEDFKRKYIRKKLLILYSIAFLICGIVCYYSGSYQKGEILLGIFFGGVMLLTSIITKQAIGIADSIVIFSIGIIYGGWFCIEMVLISLVVISIVGIAGICMKKFDKYHELAFLPYLYVTFISLNVVLYLRG